MAGDWIKMRGALFQSPKLIGMSRHLLTDRLFRDWLTPGGGGDMNGQIVSDDALRCVTCALLLRVWSAGREFGKFDGDDLILPHIQLPDLDVMAGAPGVGEAMSSVGWAIEDKGIRLPNFKQHNVPMTNAERQKEYRNRNLSRNETVTRLLRNCRDKSVTREEKRREEKNINCAGAQSARQTFHPPTLEEVIAYCIERANGIDPQKWLDHYTANGWKVGKNPMKDWKAAVRTWERNGYTSSHNGSATIIDKRQSDIDAAIARGLQVSEKGSRS